MLVLFRNSTEEFIRNKVYTHALSTTRYGNINCSSKRV